MFLGGGVGYADRLKKRGISRVLQRNDLAENAKILDKLVPVGRRKSLAHSH